MASYPGAVKVFATRSAAQTIDPSHVNDLQDEVSAIESGLILGTAAINSSAITATSLSVSGDSTLATLTVTGKVTLPVKGVMLTHSASQNVPSATLTGLSFDTETADDAGMHSTAANSSRINLVDTGMFLIGANLQFAPPSAGGTYRQARIRINDLTDIGLQIHAPLASTSAGVGNFFSLTAAYKVTSTTDYATVLVSHDVGSTLSISSGIGNCVFWAARVGA